MLKGLHGLAPGCSPGPGSAPGYDQNQIYAEVAGVQTMQGLRTGHTQKKYRK